MTKRVLSVLCGIVAFSSAFAQNKNLVGVASFKSSGRTEYVTAIQDAVYDATLKVRGFSLMGKDKLEQIKTGVGQADQDAGAIAQAKSLGAQYIVTGNILKASRELPFACQRGAQSLMVYSAQDLMLDLDVASCPPFRGLLHDFSHRARKRL